MTQPTLIPANGNTAGKPDQMFSVTAIFGPSGTMFSFLFKSVDAAGLARARLHDAIVNGTSATITDEFGQVCTFNAGALHAALLEDLDTGAEGSIARGLHNARTQARGNIEGSKDPLLRAAGMMMQQPGAGRHGRG